jgi:hypothetical protein
MVRKPIVVFLLLFCVAFTWFFLQTPYRNWDMIGYVAWARACEVTDPGVFQKEVYGVRFPVIAGVRGASLHVLPRYVDPLLRRSVRPGNGPGNTPVTGKGAARQDHHWR